VLEIAYIDLFQSQLGVKTFRVVVQGGQQVTSNHFVLDAQFAIVQFDRLVVITLSRE
jgi:hypothetical protein